MGYKMKLDYSSYYNNVEHLFDVMNVDFVKSKKQLRQGNINLGSIEYANVPCCYDTETTSAIWKDSKGKEHKIAFTYLWQFGFNGKVIMFRSWDKFLEFLNLFVAYLDLNLQKRVIVYVHNLGFDYSFLRKHLKWHEVFYMDPRSPLYATTTSGLEFRDSQILTGKSLASSAKDLNHYKVRKMVGDLDYSLIRGETTPITEKEEMYGICDCLTLMAIISERIHNDGDITKIPFTATGYVRNLLRERCLSNKWYSSFIHKLTITENEYTMLRRAFAGGFTHANALYADELLTYEDYGYIDSFDFTSSYPASILSEKYPMSSGKRITITSEAQLDEIIASGELLMFDVTFYGLKTRSNVFDSPLSISKSKEYFSEIINNGRTVSASQITTTITSVDWEVFKNYYKWIGEAKIGECYVYKAGYLPKPIIETILKLYGDKTQLKGVPGREVDYQYGKSQLNSVYGCFVQSIEESIIEWSDNNPENFTLLDTTLSEIIDDYNNDKKRVLFYPWGVFCTAYSRRNLFEGILEFGIDYIYSDTDSIKCINATDHMDFINDYNERITKKIDACLNYYGIDTELSRPKTVKGVEKQLGVWDFESEKNHYVKFKTLGAKRYCYETEKPDDDGETFHITIAGLPKGAVDYFHSETDNEGEKKPTDFDFFTNKMYIPEGKSGKKLHVYLDNEMEGDIIDYKGEVQHFHELSGCYIGPTDFTLKLVPKYIDFITGVKTSRDTQ